MKYYYDLHIHSVLSPDADVLMTPNNIFNMAMLKGLDIIAITDHNHTGQLKVCQELANSYDFLVIPGIELSLYEDFHVCVYFKTFDDAQAFNDQLEPWRNKTRYDELHHHGQYITDLDDQVIEHYPYLLSLNLSLTFSNLCLILQKYHHILVFAHIDRQKHSGLAYLKDANPHAIELSIKHNEQFIEKNQLSNYHKLYNSDAHDLLMINERHELSTLELESLTIEAFFSYFQHG